MARFKTAQEGISELRREAGRVNTWMYHRIYIEPHMQEDDPDEDFAKSGGRWLWNLCSWIDLGLRPRKHLCGAIPREHMKTTVGTTTNVTRCACYKLKRNIGIVGANEKEAQDKLRNVKDVQLETNKRILQDFGYSIRPALDAEGKNVGYKDKEVILANGVRIMAVPIMGKIRGQNWGGVRMELLVFDDPEDDESVVQEEQRTKRDRWIKASVRNSLQRKRGSIIWLGTILHQDSLLKRWIKRAPPASWSKVQLPAYNHTGRTHGDWEPGEMLWAEGWTYEELMLRKAEIGHAMFSQEFLNEPMSEEDQIFKSEWWKFYDPRDVRTGAGRWEMADPFEPSVHRTLAVYGAIDPAISLEKKADYFAYCIIGRMDSPHNIHPITKKVMPILFVLEMWRGKLPFGEQLEKAEKVHKKWSTLAFRIESQAYQIALQQVTRSMGIPAEEIKHRQNKIARVTTSALPFELGQVYLPLGSKMIDTFVEEAENFPNGVTDDMCDAWCMCQERALGGHRGGIEVLDKKREMHKEISNF